MRSFANASTLVPAGLLAPLLLLAAGAWPSTSAFLAEVSWPSTSVLHAQTAPQPRALYEQATALEEGLRRDLDRDAAREPAALLGRMRTLATSYESLARLFPTSPYSDNALWQGAMLASDAYWQFGESADRDRALRLFDALRSQFPTSSLAGRVKGEVARLSTRTAGVAGSPSPSRATPAATAPSRQKEATLSTIRREVLPDTFRVTLDLDREVAFTHGRLDDPAQSRVFVHLERVVAVEALKDVTLPVAGEAVRQIRVARRAGPDTQLVLDLQTPRPYSVYALYDPFRVVIDFERAPSVSTAAPPGSGRTSPPPLDARRAGASLSSTPTLRPSSEASAAVAGPTAQPAAEPDTSTPPSPASTNAAGGFSLSRQLGLGVTRVAIDPGHGGHDPGAQVRGLSEAEIVLSVALKLETLLRKQQHVEVILTRRTNTFVPLEDRTAMANRAGADLFLSIHANASDNAAAQGIETYFLNLAPNQAAEAIAARENAGSARSMRELPTLLRAITLNNKIDESRELAGTVQTALYDRLRRANKQVRNLGVKQAPFVVLIGAEMPSVLAEISFITNQQDAKRLKTDQYRQQVAEALLAGVVRYRESLKNARTVATR